MPALAAGRPAQEPAEEPVQDVRAAPEDAILWRDSRAVGLPWSGRLVRGVRLPHEGTDFFTWNLATHRAPNAHWRRWGTDGTVRKVLRVVRDHRLANTVAPRVGIADLSRPRGGTFGRRFGGLGHMSHQNGLDVDVVYPRLDGREREPRRPSQVDQVLSQDLVDRFVAAGATRVYVGPSLDLTGPRKIVSELVHHDDHMHVRFRR